MKKPWFPISWFAFWGVFQACAVTMVWLGRWKKPEAFPEEAYWALIWPDMFFIPMYLLTAFLLYKGKKSGGVTGVFSGGAVSYVMIYLIALSGLHGAVNLIADGVFFGFNLTATVLAARFLLI